MLYTFLIIIKNYYLNHSIYVFLIADKVYSVKPKMKSIMNDIYQNGPVVATMQVYEDFLHYKNGQYNT